MDHGGYLLGKAAFDREDYKTAINLFLENESEDVLCSYGLYTLTQVGYITDDSQKKSIAEKLANSFEVITLLAESGDKEAIFVLGVLNERSILAKGGKEAAEKLYSLAFEKGNLRAGFNLAVLLQESNELDKIERAIQIYKSLIESECTEAAVNLGVIYMDCLEFRNMNLAFKYFKYAADKGDSIGQFRIGLIYEYGLGVVKNSEKAIEYYVLSKNQGNIGAELKLLNCNFN